VKECEGGILAAFLPGDIVSCEWKNNYIDYNFYVNDPTDGKYNTDGYFIEETCM